ncbi:hypothetical protein RYH80_07075 [Halobaculum sp. MBLA0147]|uniref:hypothetical protein n=1 Tax=Halobaculum sp. MBLA0147 TaxID=3079934 RepID=UPI0035247598
MKVRCRLVVLGLAVACSVAMGIHYDAMFEDRWPYPTDNELAKNYDAHVGKETFLFGTVTSVGDRVVHVQVDARGETYTVRVRSFDAAVRPGGTVQVLGVVRPDRVLAADRVVVVESSRESRLYKFGVSILGAGLVLVTVFRYWQIDTAGLTLEAKDG